MALYFFLSIDQTRLGLRNSLSGFARALSMLGITFFKEDEVVNVFFAIDGVYREEAHVVSQSLAIACSAVYIPIAIVWKLRHETDGPPGP